LAPAIERGAVAAGAPRPESGECARGGSGGGGGGGGGGGANCA
jgi:hypothetical protein